MQLLSAPGTNDWTAKSVGIPVTALTKAKIHWSFVIPTTSGPRWMALQNIYVAIGDNTYVSVIHD